MIHAGKKIDRRNLWKGKRERERIREVIRKKINHRKEKRTRGM